MTLSARTELDMFRFSEAPIFEHLNLYRKEQS
jgi:gentisate 1,2-dioxygenase